MTYRDDEDSLLAAAARNLIETRWRGFKGDMVAAMMEIIRQEHLISRNRVDEAETRKRLGG